MRPLQQRFDLSNMHILAIETSCDETAAAVIRDDFEILSNIVLSQDEIHAPYGGVVPELASRQHVKTIDAVVKESLNVARFKIEQIDAYAVTQGPGLVGSLVVGLSFAKGLAYYFQKPLVGIDHLQAHIEAAFLENRDIPFPALALLVSGGHTSAFLLNKKLHYDLIGKTRDDAAGEILDKIAKFLDLGYPGGPVIEKLSEDGSPKKFTFGLPRMTDRSLDFSFSGLKTAAIKLIKEKKISKEQPHFFDFLASFEAAISRALLHRLRQAVSIFTPKSLVLCGGVARNRRLRADFLAFAQKYRLPAFIPSPKLCTDNAAMVAALALEKLKAGEMGSLSLDLNAYPRS